MGSFQPISRIAIIGAGPSGLAAAKCLVAEKSFSKIDVFEQRSHVGGIWNLSAPEESKRIPIPQTDPNYGSRRGISESHSTSTGSSSVSSRDALELESPLYDYLESNIPKELMAYSDKRFPQHAPLFVGHEGVLQYLEEYADDIRHLIQLNTEVQDVKPHETSTDIGHRWEVRTEDLQSGKEKMSIYDAIVVANGHYTVPFVPEVKGLAEWCKDYPGAVIHSKAYRKPEDYSDKKVLVIGSSVSGSDIAGQIGPYSHSLLLSSRSPPMLGSPSPPAWRKDVSGLLEFLPSTKADRAIMFADGSVETKIDAVIFATGYFYNFSFLAGLQRPLVTHGFRTEHLYKHIFSIDNPTLAFMVLNLKVIPFPLAENQAGVIARIWSGRSSLPSREDMTRWEENVIAEQGSSKDFHLLKFPKDADAINELYDWAASARRVPELENNGCGKVGTYWDERLVWMRGKFPDIKAAYAHRGEKRFDVRTVEELGFDFKRWKEEQGKEHRVKM